MRDDLIRQAIELLNQALDEPHEAAGSLLDTTSGSNGGKIGDLESDEAWLRFYRFLRLVEQEGDRGIDVDRQRELMYQVDYDPRASGGFFGGLKPSMRRDKDTDQRYLTEEGKRLIRIGRARFGNEIEAA